MISNFDPPAGSSLDRHLLLPLLASGTDVLTLTNLAVPSRGILKSPQFQPYAIQSRSAGSSNLLTWRNGKCIRFGSGLLPKIAGPYPAVSTLLSSFTVQRNVKEFSPRPAPASRGLSGFLRLTPAAKETQRPNSLREKRGCSTNGVLASTRRVQPRITTTL